MSTRLCLLLTVVIFVLAGCSPAAPAAIGITTRVSVSSIGFKGNAKSWNPSISSNGRFVVFQSDATNLVPGDTNGATDIFIHDRHTATTELVSVSFSGDLGNDASENPSISSDGRYVAFMSLATNLVQGDTNGEPDVFVRDRQRGMTELVSVSFAGMQGNSGSSDPSVSSDGRYVAFVSAANNLVADYTNNHSDIFVHDRQRHTTKLVSVSSTGMQGNSNSYSPSISSDGRFVVFISEATNLVKGDTNGDFDVFIHDRQTGNTGLVSVSSSGLQGNGFINRASISSDGRYVAFSSGANNLVAEDTYAGSDVFVHDRQTGATELVSISSSGVQGNYDSDDPFISSDGRYVTFSSFADNLLSEDTNAGNLVTQERYTGYNVFVHDRQTGSTELVSLSSRGPVPYTSAISPDGHYVVFSSETHVLMVNLGDDPDGLNDVFVYDRGGTVSTTPPTSNLVVMGLVEIGLIMLGIIGVVIILVRLTKSSRNKP